MALRFPESAEECVYFTRRKLDKEGSIVAWVFKEKCEKCGKGMMGKPKGDDGKVKIRAAEYICPECSHAVEKQAYEDTLTANIRYTCPKCSNKGEIQIPCRRKSVEGVKALVFNCQKCNEKILITKKMKYTKKKGVVEDKDMDED